MRKNRQSRALAERVAKDYQERLLQPRKTGARLPPVRQLAREIGVSVTTLRAAQALLAKQGLLEIRHGSGVYVARQPEPQWVGIYSEFNILQPRTSSFHSLVPHFLREYLDRQGVQADFYIGQSRPEEVEHGPSNRRFLADVERGRLAGVAILNAPSRTGWQQWMQRLAIPAVGLYTPYHVDAGYDAMLRQAVRHLAGQGCRRIAMLSHSRDAGRESLERALADVGLPLHPEWVRRDLHPMLSGAGWEEFREIWMARREKPDGLLAMDDVLFDEARIAIQELGIHVPEQLRIVAHANKGEARRYPFPVTEIQVDPERFAETLGGLLMKRLRGEVVEPATVMVPFEMAETVPVAAPAAPAAPRIVPHEVVRAGWGK
jgi:DNA-binding LacI/PurR family transcriptional regulator